MTKISEYGLDKLNRDELRDLHEEIEAEIDMSNGVADADRARIESLILAGEIRELTVEQALDLEARLEEEAANPGDRIPWDEALAYLRAKR